MTSLNDNVCIHSDVLPTDLKRPRRGRPPKWVQQQSMAATGQAAPAASAVTAAAATTAVTAESAAAASPLRQEPVSEPPGLRQEVVTEFHFISKRVMTFSLAFRSEFALCVHGFILSID